LGVLAGKAAEGFAVRSPTTFVKFTVEIKKTVTLPQVPVPMPVSELCNTLCVGSRCQLSL